MSYHHALPFLFLAVGQTSAQVPALKLELEQQVQIDPTRVFDVTDILMAGDGSYYVRQEETANITVLAADGRFVRTIGLRGNAPGRFMAAGIMGWHGDTLWSTDIQTRRIEYYDLSGRHYRSLLVWVPLQGPVHPQLLGFTLSNGRLLAMPTSIPEYFNESRLDSVPLLRVLANESRQVVDTLMFLSVKNTFGLADRQTDKGIRRTVFKQPLGDDPLYAVSREGTAFVIVDRLARPNGPHSFRVRKFTGQGESVFDVKILYSPIPITPKVLEDVIPERARERGLLGPENLYTPAHVPAVNAVFHRARWRCLDQT